jgi:hypothetical protein
MATHHADALRADRAASASVGKELAALEAMTVAELAAKFEQLCGAPTRTRNKQYLRKQLAWRIQESLEGGLSPRALDRINQLASRAPARWRPPVDQPAVTAAAAAPPPVARDPRLPPVGTVVTRTYEGTRHDVTVLADGFDYRGTRHRSLSGVARQITGRSWNGFVFFFGRGGDAPRPATLPEAP